MPDSLCWSLSEIKNGYNGNAGHNARHHKLRLLAKQIQTHRPEGALQKIFEKTMRGFGYSLFLAAKSALWVINPMLKTANWLRYQICPTPQDYGYTDYNTDYGNPNHRYYAPSPQSEYDPTPQKGMYVRPSYDPELVILPLPEYDERIEWPYFKVTENPAQEADYQAYRLAQEQAERIRGI